MFEKNVTNEYLLFIYLNFIILYEIVCIQINEHKSIPTLGLYKNH